MPTNVFDSIPDEQMQELATSVMLTCNQKRIVLKGRANAQICGFVKYLKLYMAERNIDWPPPPLKAPAKHGPPIL